MAAHPTSPQTTTTPTPSPTPTPSQARTLLRTLLSATHPTPTLASSKSSSAPSKNQLPLPSPFPIITIDASTRIMGHANEIRLPPNNVHEAARVEEIARAALSHIKPAGQYSARPVNITIQTGVTVMGSRNVVVFGSEEAGFGTGVADDDEDAAVKDKVEVQGGGEIVGAEGGYEEGRKRRAESEPVVESGRGKKVKLEN